MDLLSNFGALFRSGAYRGTLILRKSFVVFYWSFFIASSFSQSRVGEWESYTSHLDIVQSIEIGDTIVSATSGGILLYHQLSGRFEMLNNTDGLATADVSAIAIDKNGYLWLGGASPNGVVQIYDPKSHESVAVFDFDLSEISDITVSDSVAFVAYLQNQDWGILEFIWKDDAFIYRQIFNPSVAQLSFISGVAIRGDSLFAATDLGVFVGNYRDYILNYPQNWSLLPGLTDVVRMHQEGNELLILAGGDIWSYSDSLRLMSNHGTNMLDVVRSSDGTIFAAAKNHINRYDSDGNVESQWTSKGNIHRLLSLSNGNLLTSTNRGLAVWDITDGTAARHVPNSPASNVYTALTVLDDGRLVAAGNNGVAILSDDGWYNLVASSTTEAFHEFTSDHYSGFVADTVMYRTNRVWSVVERDGRIFYTIQGAQPTVINGDTIRGGVISFDLEDPSDFQIYDADNSGLNPHNNDGYLNLRGLYVDSDNNLWISNFGAADIDKKVTVLTPDSQWIHIPQTGLSSKCYNPTDILVVGNEGIFMVGSNTDHMRQGKFFVGEYEFTKLESGEDSVLVDWHFFNSNESSDDNTVWAQVATESGTAWVLTPLGLRRLTFNSTYTSVSQYFYTYFFGVGFGEGSKIVSDSRDNIWLNSTSSGLFVLLANSSPWPDWNGFHPDNSFLLSEEVLAVAFDDERGIAYIATSKGINSLRIPFADERTSYSKIRAFPSPYRIPSSQPMVIDGLMDESSLKIFTLSGRLLRTIQSLSGDVSGYQAFWDGRANSGELVGTGVYLVAVYEPGGESFVTKIAVIRE